MSPRLRSPETVTAVGGAVYAAAVFAWLSTEGVYYSGDPAAVAFGVGYGLGGLFLLGAVPLYLLTRFSVVTPAATTLWLLAGTVHEHYAGTHLHPLESYLTVWPLLFVATLAVGGVEVVARFAVDRVLDRGGVRSLL
ncbi:hypothetical protein [Halomicrobium salinisoli]|uniref:hypothetical protein n=1 Tax=Halomicrobium salinisoli TaxID=2878391 RepID=UPI001CF0A8B0|nr:hypothetical protein [Halomicrobium salinisoli]